MNTVVKPPVPRDEFAPGKVVGGFTIDHKIGEGATCIVYAATHPTIGKRAAVKVIRRSLVGVSLVTDQFIREGKVANAISHPNVADVFGYGHLPDGRAYILMEHLPGQTLHQQLRTRLLTLGDIARIGREVCLGLEAVHAAGFVHADIKPKNIFLAMDAEGREVVKLIDFGIAREAPTGRELDKERSTLVFGTLPYLAPEQRHGCAPCPKGDVYSLGVVLYRLLVGRRPFEGSDETIAAAENNRVAKLTAPADAVGGIPPTLSELVMSMLADEPEQRPVLCDVRATLALCAAGTQPMSIAPDPPQTMALTLAPANSLSVVRSLPSAAPPPPPPRVARRQVKVRWAQRAAVAVVALIAVTILIPRQGQRPAGAADLGSPPRSATPEESVAPAGEPGGAATAPAPSRQRAPIPWQVVSHPVGGELSAPTDLQPNDSPSDSRTGGDEAPTAAPPVRVRVPPSVAEQLGGTPAPTHRATTTAAGTGEAPEQVSEPHAASPAEADPAPAPKPEPEDRVTGDSIIDPFAD